MKYMLKDMIDSLEYSELIKIKRDIDSGGIHLKNSLKDKIKEHQKLHQTICSTCSAEINPENTQNFTLIFGPDTFKKKASFCAIDCLEYFINKLKNIKNE